MAYEIVRRLKEKRKTSLLKTLRNGVRHEEKSKGKKHQVFQPSFDAKEVQGEDQIVRILEYIHHNPVSKKWMLCSDFAEFPYSSALFYLSGKETFLPVVDYRTVWD